MFTFKLENKTTEHVIVEVLRNNKYPNNIHRDMTHTHCKKNIKKRLHKCIYSCLKSFSMKQIDVADTKREGNCRETYSHKWRLLLTLLT